MAGILNAIEISAAGLSVQRSKMNTIAQNIANAETTETKEGGPYRRQSVVVTEGKEKVNFGAMMKKAGNKLARTDSKHIQGSVRVSGNSAEISTTEHKVQSAPKDSFKLLYDPNHQQADEAGYVKVPDVEIINEMVDMMAASRAYEANTVAISAAKNMANEALNI